MNIQTQSTFTEIDADAFAAIRRQIHEAPELGGDTPATTKLVAALMQRWGYEVQRGIGGHGVVGVQNTRCFPACDSFVRLFSGSDF